MSDALAVDRACDRFEAAWRAGGRPRVEDFLDAGPGRAELLRELVPLEADCRRLAGESPTPSDYLARFPELDPAWLADILAPPAEDGGRFELLKRLGAGAFGTVWRASDARLGRTVALKVAHPAVLDSPAALERFGREARTLARLRHPGLVALHDAVTLDGLPALVLDFVDGPSLRAVLASGRPEPREAAALLADVAEALDYAHRAGAVHRDVTPANILVPRQAPPGGPRALLTDFGLARDGDAGGTLTGAGEPLGTPAYMSPEQARGEGHGADARSDVYALGAVLYEALTGRPPFTGGRAEVLAAAASGTPQPPRAVASGVPAELEAVCLRAMARRPASRYPSAGELAADLRRFLAGQPTHARPASAARRAGRALAGRPRLLVALLALLALPASTEWGRRTESGRAATRERHARLVSEAAREWEAGRANRAAILLDECPTDERAWEWHFLLGLCARRPLTIAHGMPDGASWSVRGVALSPDGARVATADGGGAVALWDARTGERVAALGVHATRGVRGAYAVAFSADGSRLASVGEDGVARVWEARSLTLLREIPVGGCLYGVALGPDGRLLAVAGGPDPWAETRTPERLPGFVAAFEADTGRAVGKRLTSEDPFAGVAIAPDGRTLAAAEGGPRAGLTPARPGRVRLWDVRTGDPLVPPLPLDGPASGVAFSADGRRLAAGSRAGTAYVWEAGTWRDAGGPRVHPDAVLGVGLSGDGGTLATACADGRVRLWDEAGREVLTLRGHAGPATGVSLTADGERIASAGSDQTARVWAAVPQEGTQFRAHSAPVAGLVYLPGGALATAANPTDAAGRPTPEVVLRNPNGTVRLTVRTNGDGPLAALAASADGSLLSAAVGRSGVVWETDTGRERARVGGDGDRVERAVLTPDGRTLVTVDRSGDARLWDARTGAPRGRSAGEANFTSGAGVSPDGTTLAWSTGTYRVALADPRDGRPLGGFRAHDRLMCDLAFSPDGRLLATASWDRTARLWRADSGFAPLATLSGHLRGVSAVAFTPDGRRVVTGGEDRTVRVWGAIDGRELLVLRGHLAGVTRVAVSADGRCIASASEDGSVRLWEAAAPPPRITTP